jgi:D-glycerate 3-kinase
MPEGTEPASPLPASSLPASSLPGRLAVAIGGLARARAAARAAGGLGPQPFVASVSGLPGAGKSTLSAALARLLEDAEGLKVAGFSLDDLYKSRAEREALAKSIHPLFAQRGVPGTHDVERGLELVRRLSGAAPGDVNRLPRFDKLADALLPEAEWPTFAGRPDVLVCDGWFWGARPGDPAALEPALNAREAEEDAEGIFRRAVHHALAVGFPELFACSDFHVHLLVPSYAKCVEWRVLQERSERRARGLNPDEVDPVRIEWFLQLFERVGRLPVHFTRGLIVRLADTHRVEAIEALGLEGDSAFHALGQLAC